MFQWQFLITYFFRVCKVSSMLHDGSLGRAHSKEFYFIFTYTFLAFCCCSLLKVCVFIIFIFFFFYEVSNFRNRTLTNQKPEEVIKNCQWVNTTASIRTTHCRSFHKMQNVLSEILKIGGITRQSFHNFVFLLFRKV